MGQAIISVLKNDRFYKAVGGLAVNITFLKAGWQYIYFNTLAMSFDESTDDLSFRELIRLVRKEIHSKEFVNPEAKKKLLELADESVALNMKRNSKIHASILGGAGEFYIREKKNNQVHMETIEDTKIKEIEDIGDEIAKHGRIVHEIPYEKEFYRLVEVEEQPV